MTVLNTQNLNAGLIINQAIAALKELRSALERCQDIYTWTSSLVLTDLTNAPINMDSATAQGVLNAIADAHAEYVNHFAGLPATLPATGYQYGASQSQLIGPN